MWFARLLCTEDDCPTEVEVHAETLAELESLSCDCGCALEVIGFADVVDEEQAVEITWALARAA